MFKPRPKQQEVLDYKGGRMGVAAVPGSGKTKTLSALAANLIAEDRINDDQEVLIVTLVNSAVQNFSRQINAFVRERGLLPNLGYRVRTLHGLCNDIVRERPALVGLSEGFQIVDEREADQMLSDAAKSWLRANPEAIEPFLPAETDEKRRQWIERDRWPEIVTSVARVFIHQAKDFQFTHEMVAERLEASAQPLPLAEMANAIYVHYERALSYRAAVDFQDLIRLALKALESDAAYLKRLQHRWPYVLEDEAQDSSLLQEQILRLLAGEKGNWVRVGDPNQSIYETFTTAKPEHLLRFLYEPGVQRRELPNSGRSAVPIIELANDLILWTQKGHPTDAIMRRQPLVEPLILPAPPNDPQPNPPASEAQIYLDPTPYTPAEETAFVVNSLLRWLPENPDKTCAVLVPRNKRGFDVIDAIKNLRDPNLQYVELLRSTTTTREAAGALANVLNFLAYPNVAKHLGTIYKVWRRGERDEEESARKLDAVVKTLRQCTNVEDFLWPQLGRDWLVEDDQLQKLLEDQPEARDTLLEFRALVRRWQEAVLLPIDQLILIIAQDLFQVAADVAIAHSLAVALRQYGDAHPDWRLPRFIDELTVIAKNERRFLGMSEEERGFDPDRHKGKVTITTMHSAKGLEWDRVYLMSVNNYDFPSGISGDTYQSEKDFLRDGLNLEAEALAQLEALSDDIPFAYQEGDATEDARFDYISERLRLLYVGITRARRELCITYNTGKNKQQQAVPFAALQTRREKAHGTSG